ncbi:hypothetical protein APHAL10511_000739 [Amanita phalloides]|nr:hypothetical protein APHAL10511_000739 [Amanita phalloides]
MGKRKRGGLTGLSGFVRKAFQETSQSQTTVSVNESPTESTKNDDGRQSHFVQKYDATGLVPHYSDPSQVPAHLQKYFYQRERYLSLYSTPPGCLLDEEGWFSITPEAIASHIAERCRCSTIVDAFCGVGGNTIAFAKTCQRVIAIDNDPTRLALARHNAQIYGVADRVEFILADYIAFAESYVARDRDRDNDDRKIDVVFLSPPWGGPSYLSGPASPAKTNGEDNEDAEVTNSWPPFSLASIEPMHGTELFQLSRKMTKNVAYYLPRNTRMEEVSDLLQDGEEKVEVEEGWTGSKLKAITCYFGGLASGQGHMF